MTASALARGHFEFITRNVAVFIRIQLVEVKPFTARDSPVFILIHLFKGSAQLSAALAVLHMASGLAGLRGALSRLSPGLRGALSRLSRRILFVSVFASGLVCALGVCPLG